ACDVVVRDVLVEQVGHAVDEDPRRLPPAQRLLEPLGSQRHLEPVRERWPTCEAAGDSLGVAVVTARRDLRASRYWIPGLLRPLDARVAHQAALLLIAKRSRSISGTWTARCTVCTLRSAHSCG